MAQLFTKFQTKDSELRVVQDNVAKVVDPLVRRPWVGDSVKLEGVQLAWGKTNYVPHGLGRKLQGWEIVRRIPRPGGYDEKLHVVGATGEPAFQNNWGNNGVSYSACSFEMTPDGRTQLAGLLNPASATASTIFTLPVGYRSIEHFLFPTIHNNAGTLVDDFLEALNTGVVRSSGGAIGKTWFAINGLDFRANDPWHAAAHVWDLNSDATEDERLRADFLILKAMANCNVELVVW